MFYHVACASSVLCEVLLGMHTDIYNLSISCETTLKWMPRHLIDNHQAIACF